MKKLQKSFVIPVLTFDDKKSALKVSEALVEGGLTSLEVTLRTKKAFECIRAIKDEFQNDILIGAGTVVDKKQIKIAKDMDIDFIVSPGFTKELVKEAKKLKLPYLPGVSSSSDIMKLYSLDVYFMKFFHASMQGGVKSLKIYNSLFPKVKFCPTGGINSSDYKEYLKLQNVICVGGSWLVTDSDIKNSDFLSIKNRAKQITNLS